MIMWSQHVLTLFLIRVFSALPVHGTHGDLNCASRIHTNLGSLDLQKYKMSYNKVVVCYKEEDGMKSYIGFVSTCPMISVESTCLEDSWNWTAVATFFI